MQQSTNALVKSLMAKGHHASVLCALMPNGWLGKIGRLKIKLSPDNLTTDSGCGYTVYRSWFPWDVVSTVVEREKPDVVVVLTRMSVKMALAVRATGVPMMMMLQDVEFDEHGGDFKELGDVTCAANSAFTAKKYHDAFGVHPHVIHPLIFPEKYKTETTRDYVTYINPHPLKGLDIALAVARACPHIPFLFQESWPLTTAQAVELHAALTDLPNVTLQRPVADMRDVYKRTKILLAPSRWEEAYGRVASEVQISGIPVVASDRGGLPEAVGAGGILLNPDGNIADWVSAVEKLWSDKEYYDDMVAAAVAHAARPALNVDDQLTMWEDLLNSQIKTEKNLKHDNRHYRSI